MPPAPPAPPARAPRTHRVVAAARNTGGEAVAAVATAGDDIEINEAIKSLQASQPEPTQTLQGGSTQKTVAKKVASSVISPDPVEKQTGGGGAPPDGPELEKRPSGSSQQAPGRIWALKAVAISPTTEMVEVQSEAVGETMSTEKGRKRPLDTEPVEPTQNTTTSTEMTQQPTEEGPSGPKRVRRAPVPPTAPAKPKGFAAARLAAQQTKVSHPFTTTLTNTI